MLILSLYQRGAYSVFFEIKDILEVEIYGNIFNDEHVNGNYINKFMN